MNHIIVLGLEQMFLYENGQACYRNLPEDQRADLALRIGRGFKILGGVETLQIDKVLEIILRLRLIQSYKLWRHSNRVSEQDFPMNPTPAQIFYLGVMLKESYSDHIPPVPANSTAEKLGELAQRIGEDLDTLRSLPKDQIIDVLIRIYEPRYLQGYQIWSDMEIGNVDLDALVARSVDSAALNEHFIPTSFEEFLFYDEPEREPGHGNTLATPNNALHPEKFSEVGGSEMVMSPVSTSTENNAVPAYPTPSTDDLDSPRPQEKRTRSDSPRIHERRRANRRNTQRQGKKARAVVKSNPIAESLLKGCNFKLMDKHIKEVLRADAYLLPPDPQMLRLLSDQWHDNVSQGQHALGLPKEWLGIHAAWNYIKELEANTLDPVGKNVAHMLFHINYSELCKHPERYCPRARKERDKKSTWVLDCIIEAAYPDDPRGSEGQSLRDDISNIYTRKGQWCWGVVASLGAGVLLRGEWLEVMYHNTFSPVQVDALVTYISNTRPETARLFRWLEPTMKTLMSGRLPDLIKTVRAGGTGLQDQVYTVSVEDEKALANQSPESRWALIDATQIAEERASDFLHSPELCSFVNIYTC